jgi:hypothetical protein
MNLMAASIGAAAPRAVHAFDFLFEPRELVKRAASTLPDPGTDRGRAVVRALGAHIT